MENAIQRVGFFSSRDVFARIYGFLFFTLKGLFLWEKGGESKEFKERAVEHFVTSAKLNPNNAAAFKFLGHYYSQVSVDRQRACKCYQRAVTLNPNDFEVGVSLLVFCL